MTGEPTTSADNHVQLSEVQKAAKPIQEATTVR